MRRDAEHMLRGERSKDKARPKTGLDRVEGQADHEKKTCQKGTQARDKVDRRTHKTRAPPPPTLLTNPYSIQNENLKQTKRH